MDNGVTEMDELVAVGNDLKRKLGETESDRLRGGTESESPKSKEGSMKNGR